MGDENLPQRLLRFAVSGIRRFIVPFCYSLATFLVALVKVVANDHAWLGDTPSVLAPLLGMGLSAMLQLLFERRIHPRRPRLAALLLSLPFVVAEGAAQFFSDESLTAYFIMGGAGLFAAVFLFGLALVSENGGLRGAWNGVCASGAACLIAIFGLWPCVIAFNSLIAGADVEEAVAVFVFAVVGSNAFLFFLPRPQEETSYTGFSGALLRYCLLPLYLLLLAMLYGYIGKVIVAGTPPDGQINRFSMLAIAGFLLLWLLPPDKEGKWGAFFRKWGGLFILPVVAVQLIGLSARITAYGLTTARYLGIVCILLSLVGTALSLLRKGTRRFFVIAAVLALLVSVTPLNALDVPVRNQERRLRDILLERQMLRDGDRIIAPSGILTDEDADRIFGSYLYLQWAKTRLSAFGEAAIESEVVQNISDYVRLPEGAALRYTLYFDDAAGLPVAGYTTLYGPMRFDTRVNAYGKVFLYQEGATGAAVPMNAYLDELAAKIKGASNGDVYRPDLSSELIFPAGDRYTLVFSNLCFERYDGRYADVYAKGYLLER